MEIVELYRYMWERLKALRLSDKQLKGNYDKTSWLYDTDGRVVITRCKEKWLGVELAGRWRITDKEGVDRFIENHVKPMIDELKRQK